MRIIKAWILLVVFLTQALAQLSTVAPDQSITVLAGSIVNSGDDMAIDVAGAAYIMSQPSGISAGTIAKVSPGGVVNESFYQLGPWGQPGQMCTNPVDGQVYFPYEPFPVTGGSSTSIWRIDPVQGAVLHFTTDVNALGLAIDDAGVFYLGGYSFWGGFGVRSVSPPIAAGAHRTSTWLHAGFGASHQLLSMVDGSLLVGDALSVERFQPPSQAIGQPFFTYSATPGATASITSLARSSLSAQGKGALIGVRETMIPQLSAPTGTGFAFRVKPDGSAPVTTLQEPFVFNGSAIASGFKCLATRANEEVLWHTNGNLVTAWHSLLQIRQAPSSAAAGSLLVTVAPGLLTIVVAGNAPGGHQVQVSVAPGHVVNPAFHLPYAVLELDPQSPAVTPVVNGFGIGGNSDGSVISTNGVFSTVIPLPPGLPASLPITLEGIILDSAAPNGLFYETNVVWTALP